PGRDGVGDRLLAAPEVVAKGASRRGVPELEPLGGVVADAALGEQSAAGLTRGQLVQDVLVVLRGELVQLEDSAAAVGRLDSARILLLELDADPLRQDAQRVAELDLLQLLDEVEHVAALLA